MSSLVNAQSPSPFSNAVGEGPEPDDDEEEEIDLSLRRSRSPRCLIQLIPAVSPSQRSHRSQRSQSSFDSTCSSPAEQKLQADRLAELLGLSTTDTSKVRSLLQFDHSVLLATYCVVNSSQRLESAKSDFSRESTKF